jgi:prenyltransferase beta subunit
MSTPGNFNFMQQDEAATMSDMYDAITKTNSWEWIKTAEITAENLSKCKQLNGILGAMKHPELHSGFSLIHNLTAMQYIAQKGWDVYVEIRGYLLSND